MEEAILISVEKTSELLGISKKTAYELTRRADFPTVKIGYRTLVSTEGLREWARKQSQERLYNG